MYDDFLGLASLPLERRRLIVFAGESGSGKSTAIDFVLATHFAGQPAQRIDDRPIAPPPSFHGNIVVIDEVSQVRQLGMVWRAMMSGRTVLVASHLPLPCFAAFAMCGRIALFRTDRSRAKVQRYLSRLGLTTSSSAVERFVRMFGATYTDVDLILERCPAATFDESLARFLRTCRIERAVS